MKKKTKTPAEPQVPRKFWCVMKAHQWNSLSIAGIPMIAPADGPQHFIPMFDTREQAVAWAGSEEHVKEAQSI